MSKLGFLIVIVMLRAWSCAALPLSELPRSEGLKRIAIFVGTFDPLHFGHEQTINAAIESGFVEAVVVLPQNFRILGHKTYKPNALSIEQRLDMVFFRYQNHPRVFVPNSPSEFGERFVRGAIAWIRQSLPKQIQLYSLHGSDNYASLLQRIFDRVTLDTDATLLVDRGRDIKSFDPPETFMGRPVRVLHVTGSNRVSSTDLRILLSNPKISADDVSKLMDPTLFELIRARGYYGQETCARSLQAEDSSP